MKVQKLRTSKEDGKEKKTGEVVDEAKKLLLLLLLYTMCGRTSQGGDARWDERLPPLVVACQASLALAKRRLTAALGVTRLPAAHRTSFAGLGA